MYQQGGLKIPQARSEVFFDPMLFSDDDGRLYLYEGAVPGQSVSGCELDSDNPTNMITEMKSLFKFSPENVWERSGEYNQYSDISYLEGPYLYKKNGIYYLTYVAPGTEYSSYSMGAYKSTNPLGDFVPQKNNPFLSRKNGLVRGPGHGCITDGPGNSIWVFYTCTVCYEYMFERRIGMDLVTINEDNDLCVNHVSDTPMYCASALPAAGQNSTGLVSVTAREKVFADSYTEGRNAIYAVDESMLTWWQPRKDKTEPTLHVYLKSYVEVCAYRVIFKDVGMDVKTGIMPGPFGYIVEGVCENGEVRILADKRNSDEDMIINYGVFDVVKVKELRLRLTKKPEGIEPGVIDFSVFGNYKIK